MAEILKANRAGYVKAVKVLRSGALVALPTDTVYGLAGLANNRKAVFDIYKIKKRPAQKALSVVIFSPHQAKKIVKIPPIAQAMMDMFWPGALTLVLPSLNSIFTSANSQTLALRCPDIGWASGFMQEGFEGPLVLPSANISGDPAPVTAKQTSAAIGASIPLILDGGPCKEGKESTIISVNGKCACLLRIGAIPPERLASFNIVMDLV